MFLAPELSAQFMTAPTGRARVMRNLEPAAAATEPGANGVSGGRGSDGRGVMGGVGR